MLTSAIPLYVGPTLKVTMKKPLTNFLKTSLNKGATSTHNKSDFHPTLALWYFSLGVPSSPRAWHTLRRLVSPDRKGTKLAIIQGHFFPAQKDSNWILIFN